MDPVVLILGLVVLGLCSGIFGALFGLGGGVIFVPILLFIVDEPTQAVAISLIGIIAGSVGASTVLVKEGMSNVRLGLLLEITTCIGAIAGAVIATYLDSVVLMVLFAVIIVYSAFRMIINPERIVEPTEGSEGTMTFTFNDESTGNEVKYDVQNIRSGMVVTDPIVPEETPRSAWITSASGPTHVNGARRQKAVTTRVSARPAAACDNLI